MKLRERLYKKNLVYKGNSVNFLVDKVVLPNGKIASREYMDHPGAVAVLPILPNGKIILVQQYRFPVQKVTYEIPAGKLDKFKKEKLVSCVRRELLEETGYKAKYIKKIISFWPTPAFATEVLHIFTATGLTSGKSNTDEDEFLRTVIVPFNQAVDWIKSGKIRDSKSIIAILMYELFNKNQKMIKK